MKRIRFFKGAAESDHDLEKLRVQINTSLDAAAKQFKNFEVHDYHLGVTNDTNGELDGSDGSLTTSSSLIVGVIYSRDEDEIRSDTETPAH